jgi:thiol-disulfide isomerase/thioredoxin
MSSTVEKAANIFLIIASGVVVSQYAYRTIHGPEVQWKSAVDPGFRIENSVAFDLDTAPRTMLIFTSHTCEFCRASMPFYRKAVAAARKRGTRVVAVTWENPAENRKFLESNGITVDKVLPGAASGVRVTGIPSLMLLRRDGTVIRLVGRAAPGRVL